MIYRVNFIKVTGLSLGALMKAFSLMVLIAALEGQYAHARFAGALGKIANINEACQSKVFGDLEEKSAEPEKSCSFNLSGAGAEIDKEAAAQNDLSIYISACVNTYKTISETIETFKNKSRDDCKNISKVETVSTSCPTVDCYNNNAAIFSSAASSELALKEMLEKAKIAVDESKKANDFALKKYLEARSKIAAALQNRQVQLADSKTISPDQANIMPAPDQVTKVTENNVLTNGSAISESEVEAKDGGARNIQEYGEKVNNLAIEQDRAKSVAASAISMFSNEAQKRAKQATEYNNLAKENKNLAAKMGSSQSVSPDERTTGSTSKLPSAASKSPVDEDIYGNPIDRSKAIDSSLTQNNSQTTNNNGLGSSETTTRDPVSNRTSGGTNTGMNPSALAGAAGAAGAAAGGQNSSAGASKSGGKVKTANLSESTGNKGATTETNGSSTDPTGKDVEQTLAGGSGGDKASIGLRESLRNKLAGITGTNNNNNIAGASSMPITTSSSGASRMPSAMAGTSFANRNNPKADANGKALTRDALVSADIAAGGDLGSGGFNLSSTSFDDSPFSDMLGEGKGGDSKHPITLAGGANAYSGGGDRQIASEQESNVIQSVESAPLFGRVRSCLIRKLQGGNLMFGVKQ